MDSNEVRRFGAVAGLHPGTETIEVREPVAGDRDACLKLLKSMQPVTMIKAQEPEPDEPTVRKADLTEASVTDLIRKAHSNPGAIASLEAGYAGREQLHVAAMSTPVTKADVASDLDRVSPELKKALSGLDSIVKRVMSRPSAARY